MSTLILLSYIDPVAGSILLQLIAGGLVGGLVFYPKKLWSTIRGFFGGNSAIDAQSSVPEQTPETPTISQIDDEPPLRRSA